MIRFDQVSKVFSDGTLAVDRLDLEVNKGELVVLVGPSGCGKTTTLKMVNRIIEPSSGRILIDGVDTAGMDPVELRRRIGYVIQQVGLFPHLTVAANIAVVPDLLGWPKRKQQERVDELLKLVGMTPSLYRDRYPRELSGGQQQRVGVLRALAAEPELVLMDEPFGALDPITREQLQDELKHLQSTLHRTILLVTHDMDEALKLADRIVIMKEGMVVQVATPEQLLRHPANDWVRNFVGPHRMVQRPEQVAVGEIMIRSPVTASADTGLRQGLNLMRSHRVDSLLIVDEGRRLRGVAGVLQVQSKLETAKRLEEVMDPEPVTVPFDASVKEAVDLMSVHSLSLLPVVDSERRLVGLVTRSSLVDVLAEVLWKRPADPAQQEIS